MEEPYARWTGLEVFDADGEKIGTVDDVRYGEFTGNLVWVIVKTGPLGVKKVVVPVNEVDREGDHLVTRLDKSRIKHAPGVDTSEILVEDDERKLCEYYGFDFVSSPWKPVEGCVDDAETGVSGGGS